jgi:hypothetical protein
MTPFQLDTYFPPGTPSLGPLTATSGFDVRHMHTHDAYFFLPRDSGADSGVGSSGSAAGSGTMNGIGGAATFCFMYILVYWCAFSILCWIFAFCFGLWNC